MELLEKCDLLSAKDFDKLLIETIDLRLTDLFGVEGKEMAYRYLANHHALVKNDIPQKTDYFESCLVQLFGFCGKTIGRAIAKKFYSSLGLAFPNRLDYPFHEYIDNARHRIMKKAD
jgi:hypothetical protein